MERVYYLRFLKYGVYLVTKDGGEDFFIEISELLDCFDEADLEALLKRKGL